MDFGRKKLLRLDIYVVIERDWLESTVQDGSSRPKELHEVCTRNFSTAVKLQGQFE